MKQIQTTQSKKDGTYPTELDQLRILSQRKRSFSENEQYKLSRLEAGNAGEETVIHYLETYGREHWVVLRNVWLDDYGISENDILLITYDCIYVFEVKNYTGTFVYDDGQCVINGRVNKNNCVAQARKAYLNVRDILLKLLSRLNVRGALIFVGTDNMIQINSPVEEIEIVQRNQLRHFITKIAEQENRNTYPTIDQAAVIAHLEKYQVENPYRPNPLTPDEMKELRRGIQCARCGNDNLDIGRAQYIHCPCGLSEPRDKAIVRTICEYGVLRFDQELKIENLLPFFGGDISRSNLKRVLHEYFETVYKARYTYQVNKKLPLTKIESEIEFKLPTKLKLGRKEFICLK